MKKFLFLPIVLIGCGTSYSVTSNYDAGPDAAEVDSSVPCLVECSDAGMTKDTLNDAGTVDSTVTDGGLELDAGTLPDVVTTDDSGPLDSGVVVDSGVDDSSDSNQTDGSDSGQVVISDSGSVTDSGPCVTQCQTKGCCQDQFVCCVHQCYQGGPSHGAIGHLCGNDHCERACEIQRDQCESSCQQDQDSGWSCHQ